MTEYIDPNLQAYLVSDLNAKKMMLRETKKILESKSIQFWIDSVYHHGYHWSLKETSHDLINYYFYRKSINISSSLFFQYCSAGWQVAIALITVGFAIVIALYGPVVFGSVNLTRGMEVATKFLEFILPIKYEGKPAEEKVNN